MTYITVKQLMNCFNPFPQDQKIYSKI